ncbi:MAG: tRNA lysidine(34) synthetase TilS [Alphaproteobacteria bacterium]|nr:tRNA lysidine(34) synthetase TilS [Alphaproteobacteria bacterium]
MSGGGDSLALMHLAASHAAAAKSPAPIMLTVDHGLRKGSAGDARKVAGWAKALGLKAHVLTWRGDKPKRGIEAAAREARYRLMGAWMVKQGAAALCVGHTQDDQAETFLLRLARGSGVDGLSAMGALSRWPVAGFAGLAVVRPLLDRSRAELRAYLAAAGQDWLDDPMNDDPAFDRVRLRALAPALAEAGLTAPGTLLPLPDLAWACHRPWIRVTQRCWSRVRPAGDGIRWMRRRWRPRREAGFAGGGPDGVSGRLCCCFEALERFSTESGGTLARGHSVGLPDWPLMAGACVIGCKRRATGARQCCEPPRRVAPGLVRRQKAVGISPVYCGLPGKNS